MVALRSNHPKVTISQQILSRSPLESSQPQLTSRIFWPNIYQRTLGKTKSPKEDPDRKAREAPTAAINMRRYQTCLA